ncbi:hypothetical protein F4820DRAFT_287834 [Hypoxylon rubiginosum]|uniref:Uncharacterized protein n=1 Tax=Hypoxylon rubiginosum TaxID=110542 RepID=A0ACB9ZFF3_9PEZI|nr:hypothetical protein F4820DRAFT_287834 [Hypoxylon rubiginosum]
MRTSSFVPLALSTTSALAALTPTWEKLALSANLMEANLNTDRARVDKYFTLAGAKGVDGNALNSTQAAVADSLFAKLLAANAMHVRALSDLRSYLFYPETDPAAYYGAGGRGAETVDFKLPEGLLETQGVFDDRGGVRAVMDIPGCEVCVVNW